MEPNTGNSKDLVVGEKHGEAPETHDFVVVIMSMNQSMPVEASVEGPEASVQAAPFPPRDVNSETANLEFCRNLFHIFIIELTTVHSPQREEL